MKGKGVIQFFAIALLLVTIYQLSFNFVTNRVENRADEYAESKVLYGQPMPTVASNQAAHDSLSYELKRHRSEYLDSISNEVVFDLGIASFTYQRCKDQQLNLGLDLQGGMNVVLQVSMRDLIRSLADNSNEPSFVKALDLADKRQLTESQKDYVSLFVESYKEVNPTGKLATVFATKDNSERIQYNSTDADVEKVIRTEADNAFNRTYNILRSRNDKFGVTQPNITTQPSTGRVTVELPGVDNAARVRKLLQASAKLEFWETYTASEFYPAMEQVNKMLAQRITNIDTTAAGPSDTTNASNNPLLSANADSTKIDTATNALTAKAPDTTNALTKATDATALTDTAALQAKERAENPLFALLYVPNYKDEADGKQKVSIGPEVGYVLGKDTAKINRYMAYDFVRASVPRNVKFVWSAKPVEGSKNTYAMYALRKPGNSDEPPLDGSAVINARNDVNQNNQVEVSMNMNTDGAKIWKLLTAKNKERFIAIVLDDQVQSCPRVNEEIPNGRSSISGNFTQEEAKDLANILQAGKLPAPAKIIAEEVVGPSLGAESIKAGMQSMVMAFVAILCFMVLYYSTSGIIANLALLLNLIFIVGILASISATLTLPGIAGIVLTMGMAVDANVLIHERIKEELSKGAALQKAIHDGHTKSYSAIFDSNITLLITGCILAYFGLGPVLGYATTLNIGIIMTLFTAVFVAHIIMEFWIKRGLPIRFKGPLAPNLTNFGIDFVKMRKTSYVVSAVLALIGLTAIFTKGFDYGVDFKGGRTYVVQVQKDVNTSEIREALTATLGSAPVVKTYGSNEQYKITTSYLAQDNTTEAQIKTDQAIYDGLKQFYASNVTFEQFETTFKKSSSVVGPTISDDIKNSSYRAVLLSLLAIGLYILVRFRKWQFSVGALIALAHDTLMVVGIYSLLSNVLPFTLEVDETFVAAALTVMGYSMNDTVIVFDRIREYLRDHPTMKLKDAINDAINSTLNRTITTHVTVLIVLLVLFIFGGESIRGFSFAMIIGVVFGTYSSIFVAAPIMMDLTKDENKLRGTAPVTNKGGVAAPKTSVAKN